MSVPSSSACSPATRTWTWSGSSAAAATTTRSTGIHPHLAITDLAVDSGTPRGGRRVPGPPPWSRGGPRPGPPGGRDHDHRPGPRLPPPRPGRLPALVRLRAPATRPARAGGLRPAGAASGRADGPRRRPGGDRRGTGLLPDGDAAGARALGTGRVDRRSRGRCQERRVRRRPRGEGRPDVRRGQREREGVRHRWPPPRRRDRAGAGLDHRRRRASTSRPTRGSSRSTSSPTSSR